MIGLLRRLFNRRILCHCSAAFVGTLITGSVWLAMDHRTVHRQIEVRFVDPIYAGEYGSVEWTVQPLRECEGMVTRIVSVDGYDYQSSTWDLTAVVDSRELGQIRRFRREVQFPNVSGKAVMTIYIQRWCNLVQYWIPFTRIRERYVLPEFTILPRRR